MRCGAGRALLAPLARSAEAYPLCLYKYTQYVLKYYVCRVIIYTYFVK